MDDVLDDVRYGWHSDVALAMPEERLERKHIMYRMCDLHSSALQLAEATADVPKPM